MILILDFGSQYTQLIARRIREQRVYCEIHPCTILLDRFEGEGIEGIILSGGPSSVLGESAPSASPKVFRMGIPVLGICYGLQLMVKLLGGRIENSVRSEYGKTAIRLSRKNPFFANIPAEGSLNVWMSHGDRVVEIPAGFEILAESRNSPYAAIADPKRKLYGIQFHPEVTHTHYGTQILKNFLFGLCSCRPDWSMESFLKTKIKELRESIGKEGVICALSGGVDSSVVAVLLHEAVGDSLTCIFVNNGLLRKGEAESVVALFRKHYRINLRYVDASADFLEKLRGVADPERKRKIIGAQFIRLFEREAKKLEGVRYLAQGTLYPDVIESQSFKGPSAVIKSHHNVGGLPEEMRLELVEPLRELFKDEVRELGAALHIDGELIHRHPFPGPGLAIRILGEITEEKIAVLREADAIVREEIRQAGWYRKVWQAFAVLLPVRSVGVMGDDRTYEWTVAIRCVDSRDAMTADWSPLPYELLGKISNRIINEVPKVNRVVYDITSKPPGTIEWE